jgi:hypothetical protein
MSGEHRNLKVFALADELVAEVLSALVSKSDMASKR